MVFMKYLILLQAVSSTQAQRMHLRIYAKIEIMEQGKVRTHNKRAISVLVGKIINDITYFYLTESSGTTYEVAVMAMEEQPQVNNNE